MCYFARCPDFSVIRRCTKQRPPKSGGFVSIADNYFGLELLAPLLLLELVSVVLFLCFL